MKDFQGKIAVVTGAGTGMGRELALQLASEGCHVAICDDERACPSCGQEIPGGREERWNTAMRKLYGSTRMAEIRRGYRRRSP